MSKVAATKVASKVASKVATASASASRSASASSKVTASTGADTKFVTGNLSNSGKFFFGSLCVGTFGLGCWQLDRLYEKLDKIDDREQQLQMTPILYNNTNNNSYNNYSNNDIITSDDNVGNNNNNKTNSNPYRRRLLRGVFRHDKEVLIGPRGAPAGVQMPLSGLSAKKAENKKSNTSTAGGMQPGPQGYHILTPMELVDNDDNSTDDNNKKDNIVWINRGWVPKSIVPGANQSHFRNSNTGQIDIIAKKIKSI
jgi:surfeit locus 1 family protein